MNVNQRGRVMLDRLRSLFRRRRTDPRTGLPLGEHGSAEDAISFALDGRNHDNDAYNALEFLKAWQEGSASDEWPEFYDGLGQKAGAK